MARLTLDEIYQLAYQSLRQAGADDANASAVATTVTDAERDGSASHGLFRIPGYLKSLLSGKVNGQANPQPEQVTPAILRCHGDHGYAPLALQRSVPALAEAASTYGIAALTLTHSHHFAALWPEVEALAEHNLMGFSCVSYKPVVAPAGGNEALFGTNPIAFAWPRPGRTPLVYDMATAAMAQGEVQIAARDGHSVPLGTGLGPDGELTTDPAEILKGVLLPFGGHKGSAIAMMVELMAGPLVGESLSFETDERDTLDGGPPQGGQFLLAVSPQILGGDNWSEQAEGLFSRLEAMEGVRLPGQRRHALREYTGSREVNDSLLADIRQLAPQA